MKTLIIFFSMLAQVGQGSNIAKADIESAFQIIPIHPLDYHLLGFMMSPHGVSSFMQVVRKFQLCRAVDFDKAVSRGGNVSHT